MQIKVILCFFVPFFSFALRSFAFFGLAIFARHFMGFIAPQMHAFICNVLKKFLENMCSEAKTSLSEKPHENRVCCTRLNPKGSHFEFVYFNLEHFHSLY
jgi:hypothetical protein